MCAYIPMWVCRCVREGVDVEIPIVMLGAGEGSAKNSTKRDIMQV